MNKVIASPDVNAHYPLLAEAARTVASYQLRSRATIVGNLCNGSPAGDTTGPCIVLGGILEVHGVNGRFTLPLTAFFKGPGKTALQPGDIVTAITFPLPPTGSVGRYLKLGRNALGDLAIVGVTASGLSRRRPAIRLHLPSGAGLRRAHAAGPRRRRSHPRRPAHHRRHHQPGRRRRHARLRPHQRHPRLRPLPPTNGA
jgi:CO/xanthine dehydrogenase FAD-binding subunit